LRQEWLRANSAILRFFPRSKVSCMARESNNKADDFINQWICLWIAMDFSEDPNGYDRQLYLNCTIYILNYIYIALYIYVALYILLHYIYMCAFDGF